MKENDKVCKIMDKKVLLFTFLILEGSRVDLDGDETETVGEHFISDDRSVLIDVHFVNSHRRDLRVRVVIGLDGWKQAFIPQRS